MEQPFVDSEKAALSELQALLFLGLDQLPVFISDFTRKANVVEQQLHTLVHHKLQLMGQGVQMIHSSLTTLDTSQQLFDRISQTATSVDELFTRQDEQTIQAVHIARQNLYLLSHLKASFSQLPHELERIEHSLDESESSIAFAYRRLRQLSQLQRTAFADDKAAAAGRSGSGGGGGGADDNDDDDESAAAAGLSSRLTEEFLEKQKATQQQFDEVISRCESVLWDIVRDLRLLATEDPDAILAAMEVMILEDRSDRKLFSQMKDSTMRDRFYATVDEELSADFHQCLNADVDTILAPKSSAVTTPRKRASNSSDDDDDSSTFDESDEEISQARPSTVTSTTTPATDSGDTNQQKRYQQYAHLQLTELKSLLIDAQNDLPALRSLLPEEWRFEDFFRYRLRRLITMSLRLLVSELTPGDDTLSLQSAATSPNAGPSAAAAAVSEVRCSRATALNVVRSLQWLQAQRWLTLVPSNHANSANGGGNGGGGGSGVSVATGGGGAGVTGSTSHDDHEDDDESSRTEDPRFVHWLGGHDVPEQVTRWLCDIDAHIHTMMRSYCAQQEVC